MPAGQKGRKYVKGQRKSKKADADAGRNGEDSAAAGGKRKQRRPPPPKKESSMLGLLRDTLIPRSRAAAHMAARAQQVKDREKLHADDFERVKKSVICQGIWLFLLSGMWTGASFFLLFESQWDPIVFIMTGAIGALSLLINMLGIMGAKFESDRLLLTYMSFMTCIVLLTLFGGSFCMILTEKTVRRFELLLEAGDSQALMSTVDPETLRLLMYSIGGCSLLQVPLQGYSVKNTGRLVTTMRAVSNFMETLTILMFPVGCVAIAGGVYIINSIQNDSTSAITALFVFAIGCFIIMLSALGYFGTMIHSRGMLLMFQWPVLLMVIVLFASGIWATVQADIVKSQLDTYWEDIRRFLPTTFEGRYDRVLFMEFIESNLLMMAFGCFYTGVFFLFCAFGAGLMRQEIKVEHITLKEAEKREILSMERMEFEEERKREVTQLEQEAHLSRAEAEHIAEEHMRHKLAHGDEWIKKHKTQFHKRWKEAWTKGSKRSRMLVRIACASVCVILLVVVGCGLAFLVYASFCEDLEAQCNTATDKPSTMAPPNIVIDNSYTRGAITIAAGDNADALNKEVVTASEGNTRVAMGLTSCAIASGFEKGTLTRDEDDTGYLRYKLEMVPDPPEFFGVDTSCQKAQLQLGVPSGSAPAINITTESMVFVKGSSNGVLALGELAITGANAGGDMERLNMQYSPRAGNGRNHGLAVSTDLGEFKVHGSCKTFGTSVYTHGERSDAGCTNKMMCTYASTLYPVPSAHLSTENGFMTLQNFEMENCDLVIVSSDSGPTVLKNLINKCTSKYCQLNNKIDVSTSRGSVEMTNVVGDSIAIRTDQGRVKLHSVTQLNPEAGITVTTGRGDVLLENMVAAGNIQLETQDGDIELTIPMCGKFPAYFGSFQIAHSPNQDAGSIFQPASRVATTTEFATLQGAERMAKAVRMSDTDGLSSTGQITGTIGCHLPLTGSKCPYSNELLINTNGGKVTIKIDSSTDRCASTAGRRRLGKGLHA